MGDLLPSYVAGETVTTKQFLAGKFGLDAKRFGGLMEKGEGTLSPSITSLEGCSKGCPAGSLVYQYTKNNVVYTKLFRFATSTAANAGTKKVTLALGQGGRFRVGDIVLEVNMESGEAAKLGAITAITPQSGDTGEILTVTNAPALTSGSYIVGVATANDTTIPTLVGITWNYVEAVDSNAPVTYLQVGEIQKAKITWYGSDAYVLAKIKAELPLLILE